MIKILLILTLSTMTTACLAVQPPSLTPIQQRDSVLLTWAHTLEREDESAMDISELSGYEIHYGLRSDTGQATVISVGVVEQVTIPSLAAGDYQFWIRAVDTDGITSELSNEAGGLVVTKHRPKKSTVNTEVIEDFIAITDPRGDF